MGKRKYANAQTLTQPDASDRLLTRAEVAEYLNIGTTFIEQLRRQGKLPSYRLSGKCIRYKKSDCDVLLDHCFVVRPAKSAKIFSNLFISKNLSFCLFLRIEIIFK